MIDGNCLKYLTRSFPECSVDKMDTVNPFDRLYQVNAAQKRPPAVSRFFHEGKTLEPVACTAGWAITSEMPAVYFEVQEFQPVLKTGQADEFGIRW